MKINIYQLLTFITLSQFGKTQAAADSAIATETSTTSTETTTTSTLIVPRTYTRHLTSTWAQSYTITTTGPISSGLTHVTVYVDVPGVSSSSTPNVIATETTTTSTETTTTSTLIVPRTYTRHLTSTWEQSYTTTTTGPISSGLTHVTVYVDVPSSIAPESTAISKDSSILLQSFSSSVYSFRSSSLSAFSSSNKPSQVSSWVTDAKSSEANSLSTVTTPVGSSIPPEKSRNTYATTSKSSIVENSTYLTTDTSLTIRNTISSAVISTTKSKSTNTSKLSPPSSFTTLILLKISSIELTSASLKQNATLSSSAVAISNTATSFDTTNATTSLPINTLSSLSLQILKNSTISCSTELQSTSTDNFAVSNTNILTYTSLPIEFSTIDKYSEIIPLSTPTYTAIHTIVSDSDIDLEGTLIQLVAKTTTLLTQSQVSNPTTWTSTTVTANSSVSTSTQGSSFIYEGTSNKSFASLGVVIACVLLVMSLIS